MNLTNRATVIVESTQGFILVENAKGKLVLPGGTIEKGEVPIGAAVRELYEETSLETENIEFLNHHLSTYFVHHVYLVKKFSGREKPGSDALKIVHVRAVDIHNKSLHNITYSSRMILQNFLQKTCR